VSLVTSVLVVEYRDHLVQAAPTVVQGNYLAVVEWEMEHIAAAIDLE